MFDSKLPINCIKVKQQSLGYWEINTELKKAYFRDSGVTPPEDVKILDSDYDTIDNFLIKEAKIPYVKTIIPDRKVIFGYSPFCSWSRDKTSDDGMVVKVFCQNPALVSIGKGDNARLVCGEHANFDVPARTSTSSVR